MRIRTYIHSATENFQMPISNLRVKPWPYPGNENPGPETATEIHRTEWKVQRGILLFMIS